jgi:protein ImuB
MRSVLEELGHQARLAMTDGPQLARAFAVWETRRQGKAAVVIGAENKQSCLRALPISGLPLPSEVKINLAKLGLLSAGDLLDREPAVVTSRLGDHAHAMSTLLRGEDTAPLIAHRPLALPEEELDWDEPLAGNEPVLFALRRLTTQVASRLRGRALAAQSLELTLKHDPAIARFRGKEAFTRQVVQLAAPLGRAEDLWRVLTARIAKTQVDVPNIGVALKVLSVEETKQRQLDLAVGFSKLDAADPERMAVLFSELATDIGAENFGTLRLANTHKPEKMSLLAPVGIGQTSERSRKRRGRTVRAAPSVAGSLRPATSNEQLGLGETRNPAHDLTATELPTRLLPTAIPVQTRFRSGELLPLGTKLYTITKVTFQRRLEAVEWWSNEPCSRDYVQLWLSSSQGELHVLAYVDRVTQSRYVQGWYD